MHIHDEEIDDIEFFGVNNPLVINAFTKDGLYVASATFKGQVIYETEGETLSDTLEELGDRIQFLNDNPDLLNERLKQVFNSHRQPQPASNVKRIR